MATSITSAVIYRATDKATGKFLGYAVKSDSSEQFYCVTWDSNRNQYTCNCKATKPCKHLRAVSEVVRERFEMKAEKQELHPACHHVMTRKEEAIAGVVDRNPQAFVTADKLMSASYQQGQARLQRAAAKSTAPKSTVAPLNERGRTFSLLGR